MDHRDTHCAAPPPQATATRRVGAVTRAGALLLATLGLSACFGGGGPDAPAGAGGAAATTASPSSPTEVTFSLSVGLQPGHLSEKVVLQLDGTQAAEWSTTPENPSRIVTITALSGEQPYEFTGTYAIYNAKGFLEEKPVKGSGTVSVGAGGFYGIYYDTAQDVYELQRLR